MKKIYLLLFTVFLNLALFSCTPDTAQDSGPTANGEKTCCGDDSPVPPPLSGGGGG